MTQKLAKQDERPEETWFLSRLKSLLKWIKEETTVEVAHQMVNLGDDTNIDKSQYMSLTFQSVLLTNQKTRVFVTEDRAMARTIGSSTPVADTNYLISVYFPDRYKEISEFMLECDIYGGEMTVGYILAQYGKHLRNEESSYRQCRENMFYNKTLYQVVDNFCAKVYSKPVLLAGEEQTIESTLTELFRNYDRPIAQKILTSAYQQLPLMRPVLLRAYKMANPIYL